MLPFHCCLSIMCLHLLISSFNHLRLACFFAISNSKSFHMNKDVMTFWGCHTCFLSHHISMQLPSYGSVWNTCPKRWACGRSRAEHSPSCPPVNKCWPGECVGQRSETVDDKLFTSSIVGRLTGEGNTLYFMVHQDHPPPLCSVSAAGLGPLLIQELFHVFSHVCISSRQSTGNEHFDN